MDEPTMTMAEANEMVRSEGAETNLTFVQADNGLFLVRNRGISDDGEHLDILPVARVVQSANAVKDLTFVVRTEERQHKNKQHS